MKMPFSCVVVWQSVLLVYVEKIARATVTNARYEETSQRYKLRRNIFVDDKYEPDSEET